MKKKMWKRWIERNIERRHIHFKKIKRRKKALMPEGSDKYKIQPSKNRVHAFTKY